MGTQRLKSSMTCSVPRGEIQRTVCSPAAERPNALPAFSSEPADRSVAPAAPRFRSSRREMVLSCIPPPLISLGLPARPALADEVEQDVDADPERRDDQDHGAELVHPGERRVVDEPLTEPAGFAGRDHLAADGREQSE